MNIGVPKNNTCKKVRSMLSAYYDKELNDDDRLFVEKHINECFDCAAELRQLKYLSLLVKGNLSSVTYNPEYTIFNAVMDRLNKESKENIL